MLLSISIPTHNSTFYLNEALDSILVEPGLGSYYEIVLSDNSLNSETETLYKTKYIDNPGIKYFRSFEYDSLDANVNRSVELANGRYVWIFGDDDLMIPGSIIHIIKFLKKNNPSILVLNSQSFNRRGIVEKKRVPINENLIYKENQSNLFLAEFGSYLTYIGGIVVNRELWIDNFEQDKIGTYFAHLNVLFKIKKNRRAHFIKKECIKMRLQSQTWTHKSFEIWNIYFAEIIWGLKYYEDSSKQMVISKTPFHSPKSLLASRAYGRINLNIWRKTIFHSKKISIYFKIFTLFICLIPRIIFKYLYKYMILILRKKHTLTFSPDLALSLLDS